MITLNMDVRSAAAVREALFSETKEYSYDPKCTPVRIVEIRNVINDIDEQIEEEINKVKEQINEAIENETTNS